MSENSPFALFDFLIPQNFISYPYGFGRLPQRAASMRPKSFEMRFKHRTKPPTSESLEGISTA